jgi:hypothetical protein
VFVFDRDRLVTRYRLDLVDVSMKVDEQEERVWERDVPLGIALVGVASQPIAARSREERCRAWEGIQFLTSLRYGEDNK